MNNPRPETMSARLRKIAEWFDATGAGGAGTEVQDDLRNDADRIEELESRLVAVEEKFYRIYNGIESLDALGHELCLLFEETAAEGQDDE